MKKQGGKECTLCQAKKKKVAVAGTMLGWAFSLGQIKRGGGGERKNGKGENWEKLATPRGKLGSQAKSEPRGRMGGGDLEKRGLPSRKKFGGKAKSKKRYVKGGYGAKNTQRNKRDGPVPRGKKTWTQIRVGWVTFMPKIKRVGGYISSGFMGGLGYHGGAKSSGTRAIWNKITASIFSSNI